MTHSSNAAALDPLDRTGEQETPCGCTTPAAGYGLISFRRVGSLGDTQTGRKFTMIAKLQICLGLGFRDWFSQALDELLRYFGDMNTTQWGILSACAVAFGFFCMRSQDMRR